MRICIVNQPVLAETFTALGHEVLDLRPGPGPQDLPVLLEREGFSPELILETEHLGPRTILLGLGRVDCAKLFWAVDVHLNAWWHRDYGRQFDGVLCTQLPWTGRLQEMGLGNTAYLPWYGTKRPYRPWSERDMDLCLVGRVTEHRPVRKRMVDYLRDTFGLVHLDGLNSQEMLDAYDRASLVPNESIFSEINFRLFEAASCGCLVLNQEVEGGVGHLFAPGAEVAEFGDILELDRLVRSMLAHPQQAERMGRAAWERVGREHLPQHRALAILKYAQAFAGAAPKGEEADAQAWLAMSRLTDTGMFEIPLQVLGPALESRAGSVPTNFAALARCLSRFGERESLAHMLRHEIEARRFADSFEVNLAASGAALRLDDWDLARTYWLRHQTAMDRHAPGSPDGPVALYLLWAGECERFWTDFRPGYTFNREHTVPDSTMECLLMANELDPGNLDATRRMNAIASRQSGVSDFRISVLSLLTMNEPDNWRLGLDLGVINLRAMRLRQGLEELAVARTTAVQLGMQARFDKLLASRGSSERLVDMVRGMDLSGTESGT